MKEAPARITPFMVFYLFRYVFYDKTRLKCLNNVVLHCEICVFHFLDADPKVIEHIVPYNFFDLSSLIQSSQNPRQCLVKTLSGFDQDNLYSIFILDDPISNSVFCIYLLKMVRPDTFQGSLKFSIPIGLF